MNLDDFNNLSEKEISKELFKCCGSSAWVKKMMMYRPFQSKEQLIKLADKAWSECTENDGLEAFTHHPKIGDLEYLKKKFASTAKWSKGEQSSVEEAPMETLKALAQGNADYEKKFGFIFIVCATGKSADEMLDLLEHRLQNERKKEINIAMEEQQKITNLRIEKLFN